MCLDIYFTFCASGILFLVVESQSYIVKCDIICHLHIFSVFEGDLSETIPVVHTAIAGCRIIGRLCTGKIVYSYVM
jgi:hypothetical protein